ncbi:TPA: hypothetical protein ACHTSK_001013, partial [Escherichia coli]|nr:hypothetical protein [Escherichia coli]
AGIHVLQGVEDVNISVWFPPQALEARRKVIKETILSWLLVDPSSTAHE